MREAQEVIPITQVKRDFLDIMRKVDELDETVAITKNGVPVGVLMNIDRYEGLLETIDILSDEATMKALKRSQKEAREGKFFTHEEVWGE
ncbi:MAG: type II toxin-antitoxin system Phd/YefM family antitoxin [Deltaproteobacteria bacterium]|nr:type II toxin-antitoxin system Phd/YefM family antitoxin [Deltaproteobacteria bacterium]